MYLKIPSRTRRAGARSLVMAVVAGTVLALTGAPAAAGPPLADKLVNQVTIANINRHLVAFQRFADTSEDRTRAAYTSGFRRSHEYVAGKLREAGFDVTVAEFDYDRRVTDASTVVAGTTRISPFPIIFSPNTPAGGVRGPLLAVPVDATSGCEAGDYTGLDATGSIALVARGGCTFAQKQQVASDHGAQAALVYNLAPGPGRGILTGTPNETWIPTGLLSNAEGTELVARAGQLADVDIRTHIQPTPSLNLIAQTKTGRANNVVLAGAQLDSEDDVPGINDNATGAAALLELAMRMGPSPKVNNAVRFVFWGAEWTQSGSTDYRASLDFEQQLDIAMYLHFDMLGSPNGGHFVFDGDNSDGRGGGPYGTAQIEELIAGYLNGRGVQTEGTDYDGNSDHFGFHTLGIPSGGLYSGSFRLKTAAQVAKWGGRVDVAFDPCHQTMCDNLGNVDRAELDRNADAMAYTVASYAISTEGVNGVPPRAARASQRSAAMRSAGPAALAPSTVGAVAY
jgi:Zn-dependent M28 family amino/carboxypeptidase